MHPKTLHPAFVLALSVMVFTLRGERTHVLRKGEGYLIISEVAVWRYGTDISEPEEALSSYSLFGSNDSPSAYVQARTGRDLIAHVQSSSFVRKDALTPEQVESFEQCILDGPEVEWRVMGPQDKYDHPEPPEEALCMATLRTTPPTSETAPPASETAPPASEPTPPASETAPPTRETAETPKLEIIPPKLEYIGERFPLPRWGFLPGSFLCA